MSRERILVVGGGGREHALAWRIRRDRPDVDLFVAPGNGGTAALATNVPLQAADIEGVTAWCREQQPDLVIIGKGYDSNIEAREAKPPFWHVSPADLKFAKGHGAIVVYLTLDDLGDAVKRLARKLLKREPLPTSR